MEEEHEMTSLRTRRKKSSVGISCCFSGTTSTDTNDLPEIKGKCRNFISRMARHRRHSSAEFSYDPLSYALNFDDDAPSSSDEFRPIKYFPARLPVSPPRRKTKTTTSFDHPLPRTPLSRSPPAAYYTASREAAGNDDLRRGFEALSVSMKRSSVNLEPPGEVKVAGQRRNKTELTSPRAAEVRRSLEAGEVTSPTGISSNRGILVQLC
ncbi:hypothetical protein Pfo_024644 [Paulownia fortunei]|nr:hypothetical protein Pfo_024644 [Paulownia fortunei]